MSTELVIIAVLVWALCGLLDYHYMSTRATTASRALRMASHLSGPLGLLTSLLAYGLIIRNPHAQTPEARSETHWLTLQTAVDSAFAQLREIHDQMHGSFIAGHSGILTDLAMTRSDLRRLQARHDALVAHLGLEYQAPKDTTTRTPARYAPAGSAPSIYATTDTSGTAGLFVVSAAADCLSDAPIGRLDRSGEKSTPKRKAKPASKAPAKPKGARR